MPLNISSNIIRPHPQLPNLIKMPARIIKIQFVARPTGLNAGGGFCPGTNAGDGIGGGVFEPGGVPSAQRQYSACTGGHCNPFSLTNTG